MATRYMDMLSYDPEQERKATEYIHQHRTWFIALGAALIVLGVIAAGSSVATTYVSMIFLAGVLVVGGIIRFVSAFNAREWTGSLLLALSGALYVVAGVLTYQAPGCRRARPDASVRSPVPWCRALPHHHVDLVPLSLLGMGCRQWRRHLHPRADAVELVAGLGSVVHRFLHRHRPDCRRRRLAHALLGCRNLSFAADAAGCNPLAACDDGKAGWSSWPSPAARLGRAAL